MANKLLASLALAVGLLPAAHTVETSAVAKTYAEIVTASYEDSLAGARELDAAIKLFVAAPSAVTLGEARKAWLAAREPYGQTEAYRFYAGPIDDDDGPEGLLNAWPLDEAFIDATVDQPDGGIVNSPAKYPEITGDLLQELNEKGGDANISTGYHAIEFLLWGQDLNEDITAAGSRPVSDFTEAKFADRRKTYLTVASAVLIDHLQGLVDEWKASDGAYRTDFLKDADAAVGKAIVGIGSLAGGELAGERMAVALANYDQEDEHSCFSDNTHRDIITNLQGIANVYRGTYVRVDGSTIEGPGIIDLVAEKDADLAKKIDNALSTALAAVNGIRAPFDHELVSPAGQKRVQAAIDSLWVFTRLLPKAAEAIAIEAEIDGL
jgi:putative iron-regulated protein